MKQTILLIQRSRFSPAYISTYNSNKEKQVNLLMISDNNKKWHYLFVKRLSALLKGITSKHAGDVHYLNCFLFF